MMMNQDASSKIRSRVKNPLGVRFWIWLLSACMLVLIVSVLFSAWAVWHAQMGGTRFSGSQLRMVNYVANFPSLARTAFQEVGAMLTGDPLPLLIDRKTTEHPYWVRKFPAAEDDGYLLFSGVDQSEKQSVVKLIRISDGSVIARWVPDWPALLALAAPKNATHLIETVRSPYAAKAIHPLLLNDGDIIFQDTGWITRVGLCGAKPVWLLNEIMHHSLEMDETGLGIWGPSISQEGFADNPFMQKRVRDDALAHVSLDGKVLEQLSFSRILRENGLQSLLMGTSGGRLKQDPTHLNEIKVAKSDSHYWHRGDLLISSRHLSTLFLYRPSTGKILWYKTGPWMNQHAVDFVDEHRISVFNNNVVADVPAEHAFLVPGETNQVMVYDFATGQVTQPFAALLAVARPLAFSEGLARLLPDGGLFLEETIYGRQLRFSKDRLIWSRVNDYDDKHIGILSWSRYLTAEEARIPLQAIASRKCQPTVSH
ncbi:MAG: arylsulfotransferase family protein [Gallionella sp.]|nr:arylsulfotransferase family protein [Gallionella sp.]MDD4946167.1 arylsulfotransferase family protein [Gallionella sp.]